MNRRCFLPGAFLLVASLAHADPHISLGLRIGLPSPIIVREAPPPRVVERVYVSPGPDHIWVPGHHVWVDGQWMWTNGTWAVPPERDAHWVDNRWDQDSRQWTEAHWEMRAPPPPPPPPPRHSDIDDHQDRGRSDYRHDDRSLEIVVSDAPPPPRRESRTKSPGRGNVWISGYWGWVGGRRDWVGGHWERPPHRHAVWSAPRWEHRGRDYIFIRGSWR